MLCGILSSEPRWFPSLCAAPAPCTRQSPFSPDSPAPSLSQARGSGCGLGHPVCLLRAMSSCLCFWMGWALCQQLSKPGYAWASLAQSSDVSRAGAAPLLPKSCSSGMHSVLEPLGAPRDSLLCLWGCPSCFPRDFQGNREDTKRYCLRDSADTRTPLKKAGKKQTIFLILCFSFFS